MTKFEALANETLLNLFKFFDTNHLIEAFYGLNSRFDRCLNNHFQTNQLNFECLTNKDFDIICEEYLPFIIEQIQSIRIANTIIFDYFILDEFVYLKSLSLCHISSLDIINEIISQCYYLLHLNYLHIIDCYTGNLSENIVQTNNQIWSLPKLRCFYLNESQVDDSWLYKIASLNTLITSFVDTDIYSILKFLRGLPNLCNLTLELEDIYMNGYQWEKLFRHNFPQMKILQFKMTRNFSCHTNIEEQINYLVDSFRTSFWIDEHQWFIQCDYYYVNERGIDVLYTLPNHFDENLSLKNRYSKSTDSKIEYILMNNCLEFFREKSMEIQSFDNLSIFTNDFPKLDQLELSLPFIDAYNSQNLLLKNLTSLHIKLNHSLGYNHLQILLDQSPQLDTLKFLSFGESIMELFRLKTLSIHRLDLIVEDSKFIFNYDQCYQLINSPLGCQCKVLLIEIDNQMNILHLIEKMSHLHLLICRCKSIDEKTLIINQDLSLTCSIKQDPNDKSLIHIQINRETNQIVHF